ncbi:MAG: winged helix-turn-helix transcriptional regulator [Thermoguttaceae bacterium]|nr:winged helix-turn-helix transcriptional regulator [Thermoguttaceae bacterium]
MDTVKTLKALANDTRLEIVRMLLKKAMCVHALAHHFHVSEPTICVHVRVLRQAGLVTGERKGYFVHYHANREAIRALAARFAELSAVEPAPCRDCQCHTKGSCRCRAKGKPCHETPSKDRG